MPVSRDHRSDVPVVWSRGPGCQELASALGASSSHQVDGDPARACVRSKALLYVARKVTSFDVCSMAVPHGFEPDRVREVVAFVGSGPHSPLAAAVALRLGHRLDVPARGVYAHAAPGPVPPVRRALPEIARRFPMLHVDALHADEPAAVIDSLPGGALLVLGAPGGSWLQRRFFGRGARILHHAPAGTVVVKAAPRRIYQVMGEAQAYGPHLRVADAVALGLDEVVVADHGRPLGVVDRASLLAAPPDRTLGEIVVEVPVLEPLEPVDDAAALFADAGVGVLPVVEDDRLLGVMSLDGADDPALPWAG